MATPQNVSETSNPLLTTGNGGEDVYEKNTFLQVDPDVSKAAYILRSFTSPLNMLSQRDEENDDDEQSDAEEPSAASSQTPLPGNRTRRRSVVVPFGPFETGEVVSVGMVGMEEKLKAIAPPANNPRAGRRGSVTSVFFSPKSEAGAEGDRNFGGVAATTPESANSKRSKAKKSNKKAAADKGFDLDDPKYDGQLVVDGTPECECTTLMVRNIPNKYTQKLLVIAFKQHGFAKTFDFLYVPVDFNTRLNVGYCFINFTKPEFAQQFAKRFHGFHMPAFKSRKKIHISLANLQGLQPNIKKLQDSSLMMDTVAPEYQPLLFDCETGLEMPFPTPANSSVEQVASRAEDSSFWENSDSKHEPAYSGTIFPRNPADDERKKDHGPPRHHHSGAQGRDNSFFHHHSPPPTPPGPSRGPSSSYSAAGFGGYHTPPFAGGYDAFGFTTAPPGLKGAGRGKSASSFHSREWSPEPPQGRSFRGTPPQAKQRAY